MLHWWPSHHHKRKLRRPPQKLREVLSRLQIAGLRVNVAKCYFVMPEIEYLGYILTQNGIKPQSEKCTAILASACVTFLVLVILWVLWAYARSAPSLGGSSRGHIVWFVRVHNGINHRPVRVHLLQVTTIFHGMSLGNWCRSFWPGILHYRALRLKWARTLPYLAQYVIISPVWGVMEGPTDRYG